MAFGDGVRRSILAVSDEERKQFVDAIVSLNKPPYVFKGSRTDFPAGGVTYWFKQDEIHQATHVHGGPAFLPWHRELINRFEDMLRAVNPKLSLHYWNWNDDISPLFPAFGKMQGDAGAPWLGAGFYNPKPNPLENYRDDVGDESQHPLKKPSADPATWSYDSHSNPADPPKSLVRNVQKGAPDVGVKKDKDAGGGWPTDAQLVDASSFQEFDALMQYTSGEEWTDAHGKAHSWLGLENTHISFRDPLVFLLHSNVDRLWATWQMQDPLVRLNPAKVYGDIPASWQAELEAPLQPWAGAGIWPTRPWFAPENQQAVKNCKDVSVVIPRPYDTFLAKPVVERNKWMAVASILFGIAGDGGGLEIRPGGRPVPIDPWGPLVSLSAAKREALIGLAVTELASLAQSPESRRQIQKAGTNLVANAVQGLRLELR